MSERVWANVPGAPGTLTYTGGAWWSHCRRCGRDNWCVRDWAGEIDWLDGDALEARCWKDCDERDEWDDDTGGDRG